MKKARDSGRVPDKDLSEPERAELERLRKEITVLKMEREFAKKVAGRRATCFDNAVAESFFATYKKELIHTRPWNDAVQVRQHTFLWIRRLLQPSPATLHARLLDTTRIRARIQKTHRPGSLNRCQCQ